MAAPTIDTQGPLNRRKALIAKLMAQMQGGGETPASGPMLPGQGVPGLGGLGSTRKQAPGPPGAGMPIRGGAGEGRGRNFAALLAPLFQAGYQGEAERPPDWQPVEERPPDPPPQESPVVGEAAAPPPAPAGTSTVTGSPTLTGLTPEEQDYLSRLVQAAGYTAPKYSGLRA